MNPRTIRFGDERLFLDAAANRNREIIENANDIVYTHDLDGNFTSVNRAVTALLGYTRDEAMRMNMRDILDPDDFAIASTDTKIGEHQL